MAASVAIAASAATRTRILLVTTMTKIPEQACRRGCRGIRAEIVSQSLPPQTKTPPFAAGSSLGGASVRPAGKLGSGGDALFDVVRLAQHNTAGPDRRRGV